MYWTKLCGAPTTLPQARPMREDGSAGHHAPAPENRGRGRWGGRGRGWGWGVPGAGADVANLKPFLAPTALFVLSTTSAWTGAISIFAF